MLFRERGLDVGVGEIAERAGVGRATLFRNFPTKQDLIIAVLADQIDQAADDMRARIRNAGDQGVLFGILEEIAERQEMSRSMFEAVGEQEFLANPELRKAHTELVELMDESLNHDRKLGLVRDGVTGSDALMLLKGVCMVSDELGPESMERHLSLVRAALAAPGTECRLTGCAPSFER